MTADDQSMPSGRVDLPNGRGGGRQRSSPAEPAGGRHRARHGTGRRRGGQAQRSEVEGSRTQNRKRGSFLRELPVLVVVALGLALVIKAFVIQAFYIPSASMENTLGIGDRVLVNKLAYDLHEVNRGDIVVFNGAGSFTQASPSQPDNPVEALAGAVASALGVNSQDERDFIKRVVGVPGDRVACCDDRGRVTVNGVPLNGEPYLHPDDAPSKKDFEVTVPAGELWVMGDHRSASADSRAHLGDPGGGTVPIDQVVGRAFAVVWPPAHMKLLSPPRTFEQPALDSGGTSSSSPGSTQRQPGADPGSAPAAAVLTMCAGLASASRSRHESPPGRRCRRRCRHRSRCRCAL